MNELQAHQLWVCIQALWSPTYVNKEKFYRMAKPQFFICTMQTIKSFLYIGKFMDSVILVIFNLVVTKSCKVLESFVVPWARNLKA